MPEINRFNCNRCEFALPSGWGSYTYAVDDRGMRIYCPHPGEGWAIRQVTGMSYGEAYDAGRTGRADYAVCIDCLTQLSLDLKRDERRCAKCGSGRVSTVHELVGKACPQCKVGTVERGSGVQLSLLADDRDSAQAVRIAVPTVSTIR